MKQTNNKPVRTRFAPSPTGYMHIGNLRTALYEYLIAQSGGGKFLLRIEDTDTDRYVEGATEVIYNTLKIAGLSHDEGPDVGGSYGPYVQSQRLDIYMKYARELIDRGGAYACFCSKERLAELKMSDPHAKYDMFCRGLTKEQAQQKMKNADPFVIRQLVPEGETTFIDEIFGSITVANSEMEDQVLMKADGYPTYNYANVVDDHLMDITHVVRGSEYLSSAGKYTLLYHSFGWQVPVYVHLPPVMGSEGKLSKRKGDASFEDLLGQGFLPEAIVNFIALLGWSPGGEREIFTLKELSDVFSISGLSKSPSVFDIKKLAWMNGEYIKKMDAQDFFLMAEPYLKDAVKSPGVNFRELAALCQPRVNVLNEIKELLSFVDVLPDYDTALFANTKLKITAENSLTNLQNVLPLLRSLGNWALEDIRRQLETFIQQEGIKSGQIFWPLRTALSGKESSPGGAPELALLLGRKESLRRLEVGIEKLKKS